MIYVRIEAIQLSHIRIDTHTNTRIKVFAVYTPLYTWHATHTHKGPTDMLRVVVAVGNIMRAKNDFGQSILNDEAKMTKTRKKTRVE